jgi:hypothetical protein
MAAEDRHPGRRTDGPSNSPSSPRMLEVTELYLGRNVGGVRPIVADTGVRVGSARWTSARSLLWWWVGRTVLEVREADDEPLLFTIYRRWGLMSRYDIRDADDVYVGGVRGAQVCDAYGAPLAGLCADEGAGARRWEGVAGSVLAEVREEREGTRLRFTDNAGDSPFVRMILLAAVLIWR